MATPLSDDVRKALAAKDPYALAAAASKEQLDTLRSAEDSTSNRTASVCSPRAGSPSPRSILVGWVAILGFCVNAYQSWTNKQQAERQSQVDQDRWSKEFQRAREADKYRAFFETTVLATDTANADKRLVGYALLQEFVSQSDYSSKAMLMLEESLAQELRKNTGQGIDEAHRNSVVAIVTALSETRDCGALARAARSIDKVAQRLNRYGDVEEAGRSSTCTCAAWSGGPRRCAPPWPTSARCGARCETRWSRPRRSAGSPTPPRPTLRTPAWRRSSAIAA